MNTPTDTTNSNLNPQDPMHRLAVVTPEEQPYDGGGWAGDGSGTDDLADYNANEGDDYSREDFGWGGDEALCGE